MVSRSSATSPGRRARFALLLASALAVPAWPAAWQSPESIRRRAEAEIESELGGRPGARIESVGVDERLKLSACGQPLAATVHQPLRNGRGTVAVSCAGPSVWRLFVPVRVTYSVTVVVARRPIRSRELITADAVYLEERPSSSLPYQYLTRTEDAVGLTARHNLAAGAVVLPSTIGRRKVVERGAIVTLTTARAGIVVQAEGTALEPGAVGQRIRLRTRAGRVVEGVVESENEVRVGG